VTPPPPGIPEIREKLADAIVSLYKSKIPIPPKNLP